MKLCQFINIQNNYKSNINLTLTKCGPLSVWPSLLVLVLSNCIVLVLEVGPISCLWNNCVWSTEGLNNFTLVLKLLRELMLRLSPQNIMTDSHNPTSVNISQLAVWHVSDRACPSDGANIRTQATQDVDKTVDNSCLQA